MKYLDVPLERDKADKCYKSGWGTMGEKVCGENEQHKWGLLSIDNKLDLLHMSGLGNADPNYLHENGCSTQWGS